MFIDRSLRSEPDARLLTWEVLIASLRPSTHLGATATVACGFAGGHPVLRHTEALATRDLPVTPLLPEILGVLSILRLIPRSAELHIVFSDPAAMEAMKDASLPDPIRNLRYRLMAHRQVVVDSVLTRTPGVHRLTLAAQAALPYARPYPEILDRLAQ